MADNITLRERKLNIAPAVKKQPFSRVFETAASPPPATPSLFYHNGMPYTFHNGMAYFPQTPNQGTPAVPTPELPAVFQGSGFGPQSNAQTYGPTMMYPCGANPAAAMFISPQHYNPYPHMPVPTQGPPPIMYSGGPNPSANQAPNAHTENSQPVQMSAGPPAPYYLPPTMAQNPEIFYNMPQALSQGCYAPIVTLASHDNVVHICDVNMEQSCNSINSEEQLTVPASDSSLINEVPLLSSSSEATKTNTESDCKVFENSETPVVSLLSLQEDENSNNNHRVSKMNMNNGGRPSKFVNCGANRQLSSGELIGNGNSYSSSRGRGTLTEGQRPYSDRVAMYSFVRHFGRGRGARHGTYNPPVHHDNNNNSHNGIEKPGSPQHRNDYSVRGNKTLPRGRGRGSSTFYRGGRRGSVPSVFSPSLPPSLPFPGSFNSRPPRSSHLSSQPYPNYKNGPLQMQQQIFHQRNFPNHFCHYPPILTQAPPVPPPMAPLLPPQNRRYGNGGKKPSNGSSNAHMNTIRKFKTDGMDCGAAGDAPVPNMMQVTLTPPSSPGSTNKNSTSATTQELCTQVQALNL